MNVSKFLSMSAALAVIGGSFAVAAPAHGQSRQLVVTAPSDDALPTRRVTYADLNLIRKADQAKLTRRVGAAVKDVCPLSDWRELLDSPSRQCRTIAWNGAKPQIARAIERAHQLAANGESPVAVGSIGISLKK